MFLPDEGGEKDCKPDQNKIIIIVTPEDKFVCHDQVILMKRDLGMKVVLDTSRISKDYNCNIIDHQRNKFLTNEGINKASKPGLNTASKTDLEITHFTTFLLNDPLNLNLKPPGSIFLQKYCGTPRTLAQDIKGIKPGVISRKDSNRP